MIPVKSHSWTNRFLAIAKLRTEHPLKAHKPIFWSKEFSWRRNSVRELENMNVSFAISTTELGQWNSLRFFAPKKAYHGITDGWALSANFTTTISLLPVYRNCPPVVSTLLHYHTSVVKWPFSLSIFQFNGLQFPPKWAVKKLSSTFQKIQYTISQWN